MHEVTAVHVYQLEDGSYSYEKRRIDPTPKLKEFMFRNKNLKGKAYYTRGVPAILFNLPEVSKLLAGDRVCWVEGEKDVETLARLGIVATCNDSGGGSGKWKADYQEYFRYLQVIVFYDNDEPGRRLRDDVAKGLLGIAESVTVVELPGLGDKEDVSDWLAKKGHTKDKLLQLIDVAQAEQRKGDAWDDAKPVLAAIAAGETDDDDEGDDDTGWQPFPLDCLPQSLSLYAEQASRAICVDPSLLAVGMIPVFGAMIGNSRSVKVNHEWTEPCVFWAMTICEASSKKSAAFRKISSVVAGIEKTLDEQNVEAIRQYRQTLADSISEQETGKGKWGKKPNAEDPEEPTPKQFRIHDATVEATIELLETNSNGMLLLKDELSGWLSGFGRYSANKGPGPDEAFYLEAHGASEYISNRKLGKRKKTSARNCALSLFGAIQQKILKTYASEHFFASGFASRFLWCQPPRVIAKWNEHRVEESVRDNYHWLANEVYWKSQLLHEQTQKQSLLIPFEAKAVSRIREWYDHYAAVQHDSSGEQSYQLAKLEGYTFRFALLLAVLDAAEKVEELKEITLAQFERAVRLKDWFSFEMHRVLSLLMTSDVQIDRSQLVEYIRHRGGEVTAKILFNSNRAKYQSTGNARAELQSLVDNKRGVWVTKRSGVGGGRPCETFSLLGSKTRKDVG